MGHPRSVLCFGDSNTHGTGPMATLDGIFRLLPAERWTGHLRAALPADVVLIEEGQPGRTTVHDDPIEGAHRNGLSVLPALLESHAPLDLVVMMLGTNDMKARFSVTPEDVALSLDRLLGLIALSGAGPAGAAPRVLLICPPPVVETGCLAGMFRGGGAKSAGLAAPLAQVAAQRGADFLDAGALIAVSALDGVHFDAPAHAVLGRAIADRVRAALQAAAVAPAVLPG